AKTSNPHGTLARSPSSGPLPLYMPMNSLELTLPMEVTAVVLDPEHPDKYIESVKVFVTSKRRLRKNSVRAYTYHNRLRIFSKPYGYQPFEENFKFVTHKAPPLDCLDRLMHMLERSFYHRT